MHNVARIICCSYSEVIDILKAYEKSGKKCVAVESKRADSYNTNPSEKLSRLPKNIKTNKRHTQYIAYLCQKPDLSAYNIYTAPKRKPKEDSVQQFWI